MKALATIVTALATAVLVASCGGTSGLIPANYAAVLQNDLTNIESDVQLQDCTSTNHDLNTVSSDLDNLPASVSHTLVANLNHGLLILHRVAVKECRAPSANTGSSGSTSPVGASGTTGTTGTSGATGATSSTSTTSSTATTTSSAATTTCSGATTTSGATGLPGTGGGTPVGDTTNTTGIGGAGGAVSGN